MNEPLLSLCVITGNVGVAMMNRFLDSFSPFADEICVVRAIGRQTPDDSLDAARRRGCRTAEYFNKDHPEFPHVDDFAAARNAAYDMATGKWVMWADMDDIITPEAGRALRAAIEGDDKFDMLQSPYIVPDAGFHRNLRERVIRRGIGRWVGAVHECLEPVDPDAKWRTRLCMDAAITHAPEVSAPRGRGGRNLRILQSLPQDKLTNSHRYHLFSEHCVNGNLAEAAKAAEAFLTMPDGGKNERYEIAIWMSIMAGTPELKRDWAMLALGEIPARREALTMLSDICLNAGEIEDAKAWNRAAGAQPLPEKAAWNLRLSFWGWKHIQQSARIARTEGKFAHADAIELNHFIRNGAKISLLHATRGRPEKAVETRELWLTRAEDADSIEHIFGCDPDDVEGPKLGAFRHIVQDAGGGPCGAWNMAARISSGKVLVQVSDDMVPPMGWDRQILDAIGDYTKPAVLRVSDGHRSDGLIVLAIVTREWYRQTGYFFHPSFFSMYSDNWLTWKAERDGHVIEARNIVFEHRHPAFTGEAMHPTTAASNSAENYARGLETFQKLCSQYSQS